MKAEFSTLKKDSSSCGCQCVILWSQHNQGEQDPWASTALTKHHSKTFPSAGFETTQCWIYEDIKYMTTYIVKTKINT